MNQKNLVEQVKLAQMGDQDALESVCRFLRNEIRIEIAKIIKNEDIVEDLVQETFLNLIKGIENIREPVKIKYYAARIAMMTINRYLRKRYQWKDIIISKEESQVNTTIGSSIFREEATLLNNISIDQIIEIVPDEINQSLIRLRLEGRNYQEIADELSLTEASVKMRFKRTLAYLKEKIK